MTPDPTISRQAVVHVPGQPGPGGQFCARCGVVLADAESLRADPRAIWDVDKLVIDWRPGFDGAWQTLRAEAEPPEGSVPCDAAPDEIVPPDAS